MSNQAEKSKFTSHTDISLGVFGQFTPTRAPVALNNASSGNAITQTTQGTSASAGVLGTFHQSFKPWLGYSVNLGYTRLNENYSEGSVYTPNGTSPFGDQQNENFAYGSIGSNMYELSATYTMKGPQSRRFSTFAQLGGGTLAFLPTQDPSLYAVQFRAIMVFGAGINYKLSDHLGLRGEYRGLFYKNPDFKNNGPAPTSKLFTVTNEPTVSLVYIFGSPKRKTRMYCSSVRDGLWLLVKEFYPLAIALFLDKNVIRHCPIPRHRKRAPASNSLTGIPFMESVTRLSEIDLTERPSSSGPRPNSWLAAIAIRLLRVHKRSATIPWSKLRIQVIRRDHYRCRACDKKGDEITLLIHSIDVDTICTSGFLTLCPGCVTVVRSHSITAQSIPQFLQVLWSYLHNQTVVYKPQSEYRPYDKKTECGEMTPLS